MSDFDYFIPFSSQKAIAAMNLIYLIIIEPIPAVDSKRNDTFRLVG